MTPFVRADVRASHAPARIATPAPRTSALTNTRRERRTTRPPAAGGAMPPTQPDRKRDHPASPFAETRAEKSTLAYSPKHSC